jgi:hypothetical protein
MSHWRTRNVTRPATIGENPSPASHYGAGGTFRLRLARGETTLIDFDDYERVSHHNWYCLVSRGRKHVLAKIDGKTTGLHRFILMPADHEQVDHINRDPLDNRRANLRVATVSQNACNRIAQPSASGYRGVRTYAEAKFHAEIICGGVRHRGTMRPNAADAARDYDHLALHLHGEFAVLNFPVSS